MKTRPWWRICRWPMDEAGQHTAEFVIVIALAASVAIGMQHLLRQGVNRSVRHTTDTILGPPRDSTENTQTALKVQSSTEITDSGSIVDGVGSVGKDLVQGVSRNEDIRVRVIPEPKPR